MATSSLLDRAKSFYEDTVYPWWSGVVCKWPEAAQKHAVPILLAGIFLSLRELVEATARGSAYFRITPFKLTAGAKPLRVLQKEMGGRARRIVVWVDSAVGMPDPKLRIGTSGGTALAGGVAITPGIANEVGIVPANTELYAASDVTLNIYIVEEA